jgi:hypothetical protein
MWNLASEEGCIALLEGPFGTPLPESYKKACHAGVATLQVPLRTQSEKLKRILC